MLFRSPFCPGWPTETGQAGQKVQPFVPALLLAGTNGPQPGRAGGTSFSRGSYNRPRLKSLCRGREFGHFLCRGREFILFRGLGLLMILCRGRNWGTFMCRGREFILFSFIYFFSSFQNSFRIFLRYHIPYTFEQRCLTIEHTNIYNVDSYVEFTITGTKPHLFDYTAGDHRLRLLFTLNSPASSIISVIKNPASSSTIASTRCSGRSRSRILLNYIRKGDQYEHQSR